MRLLPAVVLLGVPLAGLAQEPGGGARSLRVDFARQVAPLLLERCIECHGPEEQKGDLRLDARAFLFPTGAEDAWTVVPGKPDDSELIRRIGLPLDDEDVMPNKGQPLRPTEQDLLRRWVAEGADWPASGDQVVADAIAARVLPRLVFDLPPTDAAQQSAIEAAAAALRGRGAVVQRVAADTAALDVNLSLLRDKAGDAELALLVPLAPVLVWLNASRTAISDAGCQHLAQLTQLRRLHVANTALTPAGFRALSTLQRLETLNAHGTGLDDDAVRALGELKQLRQLYAWQTKVTPAGRAAVRDQGSPLQVDLGDYVEERLAAAQKEIAEREARNKPVNAMCPVGDKPVDPAHTLEHEGRRIGFCCAKCKAEFAKEPARFAGRLPAAADKPK